MTTDKIDKPAKAEAAQHTPVPWFAKYPDDHLQRINCSSQLTVYAKVAQVQDRALPIFQLPDETDIGFRVGSDGVLYAGLAYEKWVQFPEEGWHAEQKANHAFIIRACNCHDELVAACEAAQQVFGELLGVPETLAQHTARARIEAILAKAKAKGAEQ